MPESMDKERREFFRYDYDKPLSYKTVKTSKTVKFPSDLYNAISRNLSASGLLFLTHTKDVPGISSLLAIDLDYKTINICREIEEQALVSNNKLIGKVVRIEDNDDGTCGVGVAFVKKTDPILKTIDDLTV